MGGGIHSSRCEHRASRRPRTPPGPPSLPPTPRHRQKSLGQSLGLTGAGASSLSKLHPLAPGHSSLRPLPAPTLLFEERAGVLACCASVPAAGTRQRTLEGLEQQKFPLSPLEATSRTQVPAAPRSLRRLRTGASPPPSRLLVWPPFLAPRARGGTTPASASPLTCPSPDAALLADTGRVGLRPILITSSQLITSVKTSSK